MVKNGLASYYGTKLEGVEKCSLIKFMDARGWFSQQWTEPELEAKGFRPGFIQLNIAQSKQGVLRGLHWQNQAKLVQVMHGKIFDVAVNPESGEWVGYELTEGEMLYIPPEYAHGYFVMSDTATVQYAVDRPYNKEEELIFKWDGYGIDWPLSIAPLLSEKDAA